MLKKTTIKRLIIPFFLCFGSLLVLPHISFAQAIVTIGNDRTVSDPSDAAETPFGTAYHDDQTILLYKASELATAGGGKGEIVSIGFEVAVTSGQAMTNFRISIGHTSSNSLSSWETGLTETYFSASQIVSNGWNDFTFASPFIWNGIDNVVVQVCFNNNIFSQSSTVYQSSVSGFIGSAGFFCDSWCGSGCSLSNPANAYTDRVNTRFNMSPAQIIVRNCYEDIPDPFDVLPLVTGGSGVYTYEWQQSFDRGETWSIAPGVYDSIHYVPTVPVLDTTFFRRMALDQILGDSIYSTPIEVHLPPPIVIDYSMTPTTCLYTDDGSAQAFITGGLPPYRYAWSNGDTISSITSEVIGNYDLEITDQEGCTVTELINIFSADSIPPVIISRDLTIELNAEGEAFIGPEELDAGSSDACGIADFSISQTDFTCADVNADGVSVLLTVTDLSGNAATDTVTVYVKDQRKPEVISNDLTLELDFHGNAILKLEDFDGGSNDACGIVELSMSRETFSCGDLEDSGVPVILTGRDASGNVSTDTSIVRIVDVTPPSMLIQQAVIELDEQGEALLSPQMIDAGSTDACGISFRDVSQSRFTCDDVGKDHEVILSIRDYGGNTTTGVTRVQVVDNMPPSILTHVDTLYLDADGFATLTASDVDAGSYDNCKLTSLELSKRNFSCEDIGLNQLEITASDLAGNTASSPVSAVVMDREGPTVQTRDLMIELVNGSAAITAEQIDRGSFDACGIESMEIFPSLFDCSDLGANRRVSLTVRDIHGNRTTRTARVQIAGIEREVKLTGEALEAVNAQATYQWLNCETDFAPIAGEIDRIFSATESGNYAVALSQYGCVDTSDCYTTLLSTAIEENSFQQAISLFPNPTHGAFTVELNDVFETIEVEVSNMAGQRISHQTLRHVQVIQDHINGPEGFYFVRISADNNQQAVFKVFHR